MKDLNRSSTTPHINRLLIALNVIIFTVYWLSSQNILFSGSFSSDIEEKFVMIPERILQGQMLYSLITSMFMHAGWLHLFGNMLFLYIFGDNIEDVFGHFGYLVFYIISGLAASYAHIFGSILAPTINSLFGLTIPSDLTIGLLGASGAISGVLGAYIVLFPKAKIVTIVFYVILPLPAILFLGIWFALQWIYGFFDPLSGTAYFAHVGGFIMGMTLALVFGRNRKRIRERRLAF